MSWIDVGVADLQILGLFRMRLEVSSRLGFISLHPNQLYRLPRFVLCLMCAYGFSFDLQR